jgi:hypothetical protein
MHSCIRQTCIFILVFFLFSQALLAQDWQELKGEHFIVYFVQGKFFANKVLHKAEREYERIASDLGYVRYSNFWTWANRVKIYIYPDQASFLEASGQPEWSKGMADYKNKEILGYAGSQEFRTSILPHEIAHLIFRDFVGFKGEVPLWLDEGVAQWEESINRSRIKRVASEYLKKGILLSIKDITDLDVRLIKDTDKIHLRPTSVDGQPGFIIIDGKNLVNLYYLQSASLVGFLIERYGTDNFTEFCRQLRDGKKLGDALGYVYPTYFNGIAQFEKEWIKYLKEEW